MNDPHEPESCFEQKYIFIYTAIPQDNPRLLFNQLNNLIEGSVLAVDQIEAGPDRQPCIRITYETEVDCSEES